MGLLCCCSRGNENVELVHTIRSLTVGDAGTYVCYAENSVNSSSQIVTISVTPGKCVSAMPNVTPSYIHSYYY